MKKGLILIAALLCSSLTVWCQVVYDSVWRPDVKTVQLYRTGAELDFPVLVMGQGARMTLEFDVLSAQPEELQWQLRHCDRHWVPDDLDANEFMTGFAESSIDEHDFSFTTLRDYVHYRSVLPNGYAEFTHSGNYVVTVTDDAGRPLLTRRFCVTEQAVEMRAEVTVPYDGIDVQQRQEVDVVLKESPQSASIPMRQEYESVLVQQNGRLDNLQWLEFSGYEGKGLAYRYRKANIFAGGNTFRYFDCSNLHTPMYNVARVEEYGGEQFVLLRPEEDRSRKHFLSEKVLGGGMKVNIWDRQNPRLEADYVWVNFSLPMAQPMLEGSIYVVGALTDWRLDSTSRMDYNPTYRAYTKRLLLKQGYYAYQLLVVSGQWPVASGRSATAALEGDHQETPNLYTIYVYHLSPSDRADRLIGVQRIVR